MKEYLITFDDGTTLIVQANNERDAKIIAKNHCDKAIYDIELNYL